MDADVLVIGGGIAGVAAALRLKDRGLTPLVLEAEARVGGRMTTDRIEGFSIDTGVTHLGNRFHRMKALCQRLGLGQELKRVGFSFGLKSLDRERGFRASRPDDILRSDLLSPAAKLVFLRLSLGLVLNPVALDHGFSEQIGARDRESVQVALARLGSGGDELLTKLLEPGLCGPVGGDLAGASFAILAQTMWNLLVWGTWNLPDGVDRIPETIAAQVLVRKNSPVVNVTPEGEGVCVTLLGGEVLRARAALFALPGQLIPTLCPTLPDTLKALLSRTRYSPMASAHVALETPPRTPWPGYGFAAGVEEGVEIELEHLRAPGRCPKGCGLISVYFFQHLNLSETAMKTRAQQIVLRHFPDAGAVRFVHLIRWPMGIAQFPPGRLTELAAFRRSLCDFSLPLEFAGDWLDGLASEGALRTGEQAAERLSGRLLQGS